MQSPRAFVVLRHTRNDCRTCWSGQMLIITKRMYTVLMLVNNTQVAYVQMIMAYLKEVAKLQNKSRYTV